MTKEEIKIMAEKYAVSKGYDPSIYLPDLKNYDLIYDAFIAGAEYAESENERLKAEGEWIEIDPNVINQIPDEDVWTYWFKTGDIEFTPKGDYIPLGAVTHYMPLVKPQPPNLNRKK